MPPALERLKDLLVLVPAAHLLICFIYLFFYYASFGSGVVFFSSPADIFSVSLQDVAPSYVSLFLGLGLAYLIFLDPKKGNVFYLDKLTDEERTSISARRFTSFVRISVWSMIVVLAATQIAYFHASGVLEYNLLRILCSLVALVGSIWIGTKFSLSKTYSDMIMIAGLVLSSVMISGVRDGHYDRSRTFADYMNERPRCRSAVVLRNVASLYLAVLPDERRVLIDGDCKIKFQLRSREDFQPLPAGAPIEVITGHSF